MKYLHTLLLASPAQSVAISLATDFSVVCGIDQAGHVMLGSASNLAYLLAGGLLGVPYADELGPAGGRPIFSFPAPATALVVATYFGSAPVPLGAFVFPPSPPVVVPTAPAPVLAPVPGPAPGASVPFNFRFQNPFLAFRKTFVYLSGDSNTYGVYAPPGQSLADKLQALLGPDYQVYNGGISSQSTNQLVGALERNLSFAWKNPYKPETEFVNGIVCHMSGTNDPVQTYGALASLNDLACVSLICNEQPAAAKLILSTCVERLDIGNANPGWFSEYNQGVVDNAFGSLAANGIIDLRSNPHLVRHDQGVNDDYWRLPESTASSVPNLIDRIHWGQLGIAEEAIILARAVRIIAGDTRV